MGRRTWRGTAEIRDRLIASDPGLSRLRTAVFAAVAMAGAMAVEYGFAQVTHAGAEGTMVSMMLGTVIAMMGSMALTGSAVKPKVATAAFFPVAMGVGLTTGISVAGHTSLMFAVFVIVMFAAVFVRRFGTPFFFYGFMAWMGFFFAAFVQPSMADVPTLLAAAAISSAWVLFLSVTVLRTNSQHALRRVRRAFGARARAVSRACAELLTAADPQRRERLRGRLHARQLRLAEAALMIEGWSAEPGALPDGWSATALRRRLLDAQLAIDALATAADSLATAGGPAAAIGARIADQLARRDHRAVERTALPLLDSAGSLDTLGASAFPGAATATAAGDPTATAGGADAGEDGSAAAYQLAAAAMAYVDLARTVGAPPPTTALEEEFEPAVTLALGNLPGSASVARDVVARGRRWNPLRHRKLSTRQAVQAAVAGGLSIIIGREISEARYYWAVIAAFIAFTGTATRSETFLKATNRVAGTLAGLFAGVGLAHVTAGHTMWVLVVIVLSMACGFYLMRVSYACMIFFVTIMLAQLYTVLHTFSTGLLVLRLEETTAGAAVGILVALLILPTSTRDTVNSARSEYFSAVAELLRGVAGRLDGSAPNTDLDALARAVDHQLRGLALVAAPLTRRLVWGNDPRLVRHRLTLYAAVARWTRALALAPARVTGRAAAQGLSEVPQALADAAAELADHPDRSAEATAETTRHLAVAERRLSRHRPERAAPLPTMTLSLAHLCRLLTELATAPAIDATVPPGPSTPRSQLLAHSAEAPREPAADQCDHRSRGRMTSVRAPLAKPLRPTGR